MKRWFFLIAILICSLGLMAGHSALSAAASPRDPQSYPGQPGQTIIKCESNNGKLKYCPIGDARQSVEMMNQISSSPCVRGQTWGNDGRGVWVDRGCRANFRITTYGGSPGWWDTPPGHKPGGMPKDGACFYTAANFTNDYFCQSRGNAINVPKGFNDAITSIRVYGRVNVTVYNDANFAGPSAVTRQSIPDLRSWNYAGYNNKSWNNRISSVRVN